MKQSMVMIQKELTELVRTGKITLLVIVFSIFGIMNPALAKLTPWMLGLMGSSLAEQGITIGPIAVNALTAWTQYFKNLLMEYILILAVFSGIFAQEYGSGTLVNILTKGVSRGKVAAAKLTAALLSWSVCYWLAFFITLGYSAYFWGDAPMSGIWFAAVCAYLMGVWLLSLELAFASAFSNGMYALLCTAGVYAILYALSMIPALAAYLPTRLGDGLTLLTGDRLAVDFMPSVWISLVWCAVNAGLMTLGISKKQL